MLVDNLNKDYKFDRKWNNYFIKVEITKDITTWEFQQVYKYNNKLQV